MGWFSSVPGNGGEVSGEKSVHSLLPLQISWQMGEVAAMLIEGSSVSLNLLGQFGYGSIFVTDWVCPA